MSNTLFRRARMLFGVGVGTVLIGLTVSACGSSAAAVSGTTPIPTSSAVSSPPATTVPVTTPARVLTTTPPHPTPKPVPTLGTVWRPGGRGYGTAHPGTIDNDGDPTGLVTNVRWQSWGSPTAVATGISSDPGNGIVANAVQRQATVQAFDLGLCQGKLMYRAIEWYFPADGQKFDPHKYINICTGEYVGSR